jgi:hypothetical protein
VEEECRRSIDMIVHVAKIDGVRAVQQLVRVGTS